MRWLVLLLLSLPATAQSSLSVELTDGVYDIVWNGFYLGTSEGGFRLNGVITDTHQLDIRKRTEASLSMIHRSVFLDGKSAYSYRMIEKNGHPRLRLSSRSASAHFPLLSLVSDSLWDKPVTASALPQQDATLPNGIGSSAEFEPDLLPLCSLENEFDRVQHARKLCMQKSISESALIQILSCLKYDSSRLMLLSEIHKTYKELEWFQKLGVRLEFDANRQQFEKLFRP
jgi:hypothetical protein